MPSAFSGSFRAWEEPVKTRSVPIHRRAIRFAPMNRTVLAFSAIALLAIVVLLALLFRPHASDAIQASGTIEATQSDVAAKAQGRLVTLNVRDGVAVRKGQIVATLEQTTPALSMDQARANVDAAAAQVASARSAFELQRDTYAMQVAQAGAGVSIAQANLGQAAQTLGIETSAAALRVDQAQSQVDAAQSAYRRARTELTRARNLVRTGDEPQRALDDAAAQYAATAAQVRAAHDDLALAQANRRSVQIREFGVQASGSAHRQSIAAYDVATAQSQLVTQRHAQLLAAQAQLDQARAALALARDQVRETRLVAPFDGYIISHNFEVGDLVSPGSAVMTIADLRRPYLYVYIDETDLPRIKAGMHADVTIDGVRGRTYAGTVTEIANSAEFTPENVQTKEQRIEYLVFRIKIQFSDTTGTLKPGLPADAVLRV